MESGSEVRSRFSEFELQICNKGRPPSVTGIVINLLHVVLIYTKSVLSATVVIFGGEL